MRIKALIVSLSLAAPVSALAQPKPADPKAAEAKSGKPKKEHGTMKGKTRPMTIEQLMDGLVKPQTDLVKKSLEAPTLDEKAWKKLAMAAALLNESSYLMMDDGRSPDTVWATASETTMRTGSAALLKAAQAKDTAGAKTAFGEMTKSCKACHDVHK